jgi:hypothetical protein
MTGIKETQIEKVVDTALVVLFVEMGVRALKCQGL